VTAPIAHRFAAAGEGEATVSRQVHELIRRRASALNHVGRVAVGLAMLLEFVFFK
jgi:hypothetical protein